MSSGMKMNPTTRQFAMMPIPEQPKPKIPTTRGGGLCVTHVKLGEMSLISENSFIELNGLLELLQQTEQHRQDPELRRMRLRMQTVAAALEKMSTEIDYILLLTKGKSFASRYTGTIEPRERYKRKLASRMGLKTSTCMKTESLLQLEQAITQDKPSKRQMLLPQKERQSERDSCKQVDIVNKKFDLGLPLPANKHHYMLAASLPSISTHEPCTPCTGPALRGAGDRVGCTIHTPLLLYFRSSRSLICTNSEVARQSKLLGAIQIAKLRGNLSYLGLY